MVGKRVVGLIEEVEINGKKFKARIDTGAQTSSLDKGIAKKLGLNDVVRRVKIRSASGRSSRHVVRADLKIKGCEMNASFSVVDRSHMTYKVLIGRNVLKEGFIVDCSK